MRITGNDHEGQDQLGNFIDPESTFPVIVTTSRLLSTGVDVQTCRLIVLDRAVGSMTEFKQILGRGTRVHEDTQEVLLHAHRLPERDATTSPTRTSTASRCRSTSRATTIRWRRPTTPPTMMASRSRRARRRRGRSSMPGNDIAIDADERRRRKIYVDGVPVTIVAERVEYLDEDGKLVTESLRDFTQEGAAEALRQPRRRS